MEIKIFLEPPRGFISNLAVVGCYCLFKKTFLLLKRHPNCLAGGMWCLPGGKLEQGESHIEGAKRELHEESGIKLVEQNLSLLSTFYLDKGDLQYDFTIYCCNFQVKPELIVHQKEHTEGKWVTHEEAMTLPLIHGGSQILEYCLQKRMQSRI